MATKSKKEKIEEEVVEKEEVTEEAIVDETEDVVEKKEATKEKAKSTAGKGMKLLKCVHGIIWMTCAKCCNKNEKEIQQDLKNIQEEMQYKMTFDYQEPIELGEMEDDNDYDIEI